MNTLNALFTWTLDASLRASLLAGAVMLIQAALRGRISARCRYALWLPVLLVLVMPVLPQSRWSAENLLADRTPAAEPPSPLVFNAPLLEVQPLTRGDAIAETAPIVTARRIDVLAAMRWAWIAGVGICSVGGLAFHWAMMRRMKHGAVSKSAALMTLVRTLSAQLKLRRAPIVIVSTAVDSPAVVGLWKPVLLLPADFHASFGEEEAKLVLMHELMHLKRKDLPVNALLCAVQAMHWFNPILWFAAGRARHDRESACDAQVLASSTEDCRNDYGRALLKVQSSYSPRGFSLGLVGIFGGQAAVRARILSISNHRRAHPMMGLITAALMLGLVMLGATRAESSAKASPSTAPIDQNKEDRLIALELKFIEIKAKPGEALALPKELQALIEPRNPREDRVLLSEPAFSATLRSLLKSPNAKVVSYPRMVTLNDRAVTIRSVVNQPVKFGDTIEHLPVGTVCDFAPKIMGKGVIVRCDLKLSEFADPDGSQKVSDAKSLAEAESHLTTITFKVPINFEEQQSAVLAMHWPDKPEGRRITLVTVTPKIIDSGGGGLAEETQPVAAESTKPTAKAGIAAVVNGTPILSSELSDAIVAQRQMILYKHRDNPKQSEAELAKLERTALDSLIDRQLILAEFKKLGGSIKPKYIEDDIENIIKTQFKGDRDAFVADLAKSGKTLKKFREMREAMIIVAVMRARHDGKPPAPTPEEVQKYYDDHPAKRREKDMLKISTITIPKHGGASPERQKQLAEDLHAKIVSGADFVTLARASSQDSRAEHGGAWEATEANKLSPAIREPAMSTKVGDLAQLVEDEHAFIIIRVDEKKLGPLPPLDALRVEIEETIKAERSAAEVEKWLAELRGKAVIRRL